MDATVTCLTYLPTLLTCLSSTPELMTDDPTAAGVDRTGTAAATARALVKKGEGQGMGY